MAAISKFEDIQAWQTARALNREIYRVSRRKPFADDWALCLQIRRASISVMSNIAEGFESRTQRQFIEYLGRAKASCGEVRAQLYAAVDAEYIDEKQFDGLSAQAELCSRQICRFIQYLETQPDRLRVRDGRTDYVVDAAPGLASDPEHQIDL